MPDRFRGSLPKIILTLSALALALGFLGAVEYLAQPKEPSATDFTESADYKEFLKESARPLFNVKTIAGQPHLIRNKLLWEDGADETLPLDKPKGVRRILIAGESSGFLLAMALQDQIARGPHAREYKVLDCAVSGGGLAVVQRRFKECMNYSPDAVVLVFGHNLYYYQPFSRFLSSPLLLHLTSWARKSALLNLLGSSSNKFTDAGRWRALEEFIDAAAHETSRRNIPLMLATLPSNLWVEPKPSPDDETSPIYLKASLNYAMGNRKQAIDILAHALDFHASALWHFTLGVWLYRGKSWREANAQLTLARDLDPARMRASTAVNTIIRVASVRDGTLLLDANRIIASRAPHGIPGWGNFWDSQHVTRADFQYLACLCAHQFMNNGWNGLTSKLGCLAPAAPPYPYSYQGTANAYSVVPRPDPSGWRTFSYFAQKRLSQMPLRQASVLLAAAFPALKKRAAAFLGLAEALKRSGRIKDAQTANQEAQRIAPGWDEPDLQLGFFDIRAKRYEQAENDFRQASRKNPNDLRAAFLISFLESMRAPSGPRNKETHKQ